MGSPPKAMQGLLKTKAAEITPYSSLQSFSRIDKSARPESIGPHSGLYRKIQMKERHTKMNKDIKKNTTHHNGIVKFRKVNSGRPLSPLRQSSYSTQSNTEKDDESTFYSMSTSGKELRARNSPYLKHLKESEREEMLMELGSISISSIAEVNSEMKLRMMLASVDSDSNKVYRMTKNHKSSSTSSSMSSTSSSSSSPLAINRNASLLGTSSSVTANTAASATSTTVADTVDNDWWPQHFEGLPDDPVGPFVDLSPSVSAGSGDRSWHENDEGPFDIQINLGRNSPIIEID